MQGNWTVLRHCRLALLCLTTAIFSQGGIFVLADQPVLPAEVSDGGVQSEPELKKSIQDISETQPLRIKRDGVLAKRLAKYHWLDKAAAANPLIVEAITCHRDASKILARHPRLGNIAEADHYLCRRLTRWKEVARIMAANPEAQKVVGLDPEGIYTAVRHDRRTARILSRNPNFDQMVVDNPDLGKVVASYM